MAGKLFVFGAPFTGADTILTTIYAGQCDGGCVILPWGQTSFGGWETSSGSSSGGYSFTNFDARINKQLSLGATSVVVLLQPISFGGSNTNTPSYVFTTGWAASLSTPQLFTAASPEYPGNGSIPLNTVAQGVDDTAFPAAWQLPFVTAWSNAVVAALDHMQAAAYADKIAYVRVGGGAGAEWLVYGAVALETLCSPATINGLQTAWTGYMNTIQVAMNGTSSGFEFGSSTNGGDPAPFNIPYNFADAESVVCVANGFGLGNQGLQNNDISTFVTNGTTSGGAATVGWSSNGFIHNFFLGGAPFYECQTLDVSNPTYVGIPPRGTMGSLVPLLPFGVARGTQRFELYFQDWQVAYDPTNPNFATYSAAYLSTFTNVRSGSGPTIGHCPTQLIGGSFMDPLGNPISYGFLRLQLTPDTLICTANGQLVAGRTFRVHLDQNGNIAGTVNVEPNDLLTPTGSQYIVNLFDRNGQQVWASPHLWTITSFPTVDVGTIIPN